MICSNTSIYDFTAIPVFIIYSNTSIYDFTAIPVFMIYSNTSIYDFTALHVPVFMILQHFQFYTSKSGCGT